MSYTSRKKSGKFPKTLTRHSSSEVAANVAAGPVRFRAELNTNLEDERNRGSSQTVSIESQGEFLLPMQSITAVVAGSVEGNLPAKDTGHTRREKGGRVVASLGWADAIVPLTLSHHLQDPWHDRKTTTLKAPLVPVDVVQGTMDGFGPLKVLLESISTTLTDHKEAVATGNKIEGLLWHVAQLDALFATPPSNVAEQRRRNELIRKFEDVEGQLRASYENPGPQHIAGTVGDDVLNPLEDLQELIFRYKTAQQIIIDDQGLKSMDPAEAAVLNNFPCAQQAEYRHGNRGGCLKGTRSAVLGEIELWMRDFYKPPVYWLNGLAGTGKSTIAQTTAERLFANGRLGASFFCSRDFEDRRDLQSIFPTLAVQLARKYAKFRSIFVPLVRSDPEIAKESLYGQMNRLIFRPLVESAISTVIVIDALDECEDDEPASAILSVLCQFVAEIPQVKFFVTGRPELRIREGFRLPLLTEATDVFVLHEIELSRVNRDIRVFFAHKFMELKARRRGLDDWPTEDQLDILCERAAGLFVHAVATIRFIDQRNGSPKRQLDRLLRTPGSSALEGKTRFRADATLDSLYMTILHEAFGVDDPEDDHRIRSILGAVVLAANPLSPSAIAILLNLDAEEVIPLLSSLHSLLVLQEDIDHPVRAFHKSFSDFIIDPVRCSNPRFRICPPDQHVELLVSCLELMNQRLEQNMCDLPTGVLNPEAGNLKERSDQCIEPALQYACRSWHKHLVQDTPPAQKLKITPILSRFLEKKFLYWLEALSVLVATREAVDALELTTKWLDGSPLLDLANDCSRFLLTFFEVISASASHIYISALPLAPENSIVRKLYQQYARPLARVVRGLPILWEPVVATVYHKEFTTVAAWSPCNKLIAVAKHETVEIMDAITLKRLSTFELQTDSKPKWLSFSPDSRFLVQFHANGYVAVWEPQTGGLVRISSSELSVYPEVSSSTCSPDGRTFAFASPGPLFSPLILVYDLSGMHRKRHFVRDGYLMSPIWTHGECVRFATLGPCFITIRELAFAGEGEPRKVMSLPAPDRTVDTQRGLLFLQAPPRLAFISERSTLIWDARDSKLLLDSVDGTQAGVMQMSFSPGGRFFACITCGEGLRVWKESPAGYVLHQKLGFTTTSDATLLFSPSGESIVTFNGPTIRLLPTKGPTPRSTNVPTDADDQANFILGVFQNEELAAVARVGMNTVTIFDLKSGDTRATLDAGMEVFCLRASGGTLVVTNNRGKVVTWNVPTGESTFDALEHTTDQITTLFPGSANSLSPEFSPITSISPDLNYIAVIRAPPLVFSFVTMYNMSSKSPLSAPFSKSTSASWFVPKPRRLVLSDSRAVGWVVAADGKCSRIAPEEVSKTTERPSGGFPWESACGFEVKDDGWVFDSTKKRLLWLPHYWRSGELDRTWHGRFLGLLQHELPDAVVLEFRE